MRYKILVVDDDRGHIENVLDAFESRDWEVVGVASAAEADKVLSKAAFDLILLDVNMPGMDGMQYCRQLRMSGNKTPIMMCTANAELEQKIAGLEIGADDYITKPFSLRELCARIEAMLRRLRPERLQVGDLIFDTKLLKVTRAGQEISLKPTSLKILNELMRLSPGIVRRDRLEQTIWGGEPPDSDSLRANLYLLRQEVDKPFKTKLIHTHVGIGWPISVRDDENASDDAE